MCATEEGIRNVPLVVSVMSVLLMELVEDALRRRFKTSRFRVFITEGCIFRSLGKKSNIGNCKHALKIQPKFLEYSPPSTSKGILS